jgi:hypothetical protein
MHTHTCAHAHTRATLLGKSLLLTIAYVVAPRAFELSVEILRKLTILKKDQLLFLNVAFTHTPHTSAHTHKTHTRACTHNTRAYTHAHTHMRARAHTCYCTRKKILLLTISHVVAPRAFLNLVSRSGDNLLS